MTTTLPELWTDWCSVTGVPEQRIDEPTLTLFSRQVDPSQVVLAKLRRLLISDTAPAWPRAYRDDPESLHLLIRRAGVMIQDRATHWVLRLRLRRMLFAAVLIAPSSREGLGPDRARAISLRPGTMRQLRPRIGVTNDQESCPACAPWSWLDVLGTNSGWSHGAVRALGHRRDEDGGEGEHRCSRPDASPDWHLCVGMLPADDRRGDIDSYFSMHPSSLSAVINAMSLMLERPEPVPAPVPELRPTPPRREISREEEEQIFARANELTKRVAAILKEYSRDL